MDEGKNKGPLRINSFKPKTPAKVETEEEIKSKSAAEDFFATVDNLKPEESGKSRKEIREIKIIEAERVIEERHMELLQLIHEMLENEKQKEARGEIPEKISSVTVTNNNATLTLDYFDTIVVKKFDFNTKQWTKISETPKPEFNQPIQ
jgi:hypothetical protein